jgi:hypothetical protein
MLPLCADVPDMDSEAYIRHYDLYESKISI